MRLFGFDNAERKKMSKWAIDRNDAFTSLVRILNTECLLRDHCEYHSFLHYCAQRGNSNVRVSKFAVTLERISELMFRGLGGKWHRLPLKLLKASYKLTGKEKSDFRYSCCDKEMIHNTSLAISDVLVFGVALGDLVRLASAVSGGMSLIKDEQLAKWQSRVVSNDESASSSSAYLGFYENGDFSSIADPEFRIQHVNREDEVLLVPVPWTTIQIDDKSQVSIARLETWLTHTLSSSACLSPLLRYISSTNETWEKIIEATRGGGRLNDEVIRFNEPRLLLDVLLELREKGQGCCPQDEEDRARLQRVILKMLAKPFDDDLQTKFQFAFASVAKIPEQYPAHAYRYVYIGEFDECGDPGLLQRRFEDLVNIKRFDPKFKYEHDKTGKEVSHTDWAGRYSRRRKDSMDRGRAPQERLDIQRQLEHDFKTMSDDRDGLDDNYQESDEEKSTEPTKDETVVSIDPVVPDLTSQDEFPHLTLPTWHRIEAVVQPTIPSTSWCVIA